MSKPAGKCVFCGGTPLTKGHIWPDWISKVLPYQATQHVQITGGDFSTFAPKMRVARQLKTVRQGHAGVRKLRNTCAKCNSGWMSRMENEAIAPLSSLMVGQRAWLNRKMLKRVAALACLITIRAEFSDPSTQAVSIGDRDWLREHGEPPPFWQIWLAKYGGPDPNSHWLKHVGLQLVSSPDESITPGVCDTQTTTFVLGQLCVHTFSSTVWPEFSGYRNAPLCEIWPLTGWDVDSRSLPTIDEAGMRLLAESLARNIRAVTA